MNIFKTITILGIVGGVAYVIYRSYHTYKAETEGGISGEDIRLQRDIEEAKKTVAEHEANVAASREDDETEIEEESIHIADEVLDEIEARREMLVIRPQIPLEATEGPSEEGSTADDYFDEEEAIDELDDCLNTDGIIIERTDEKLRHDPNSKAAIDQYKLMIMSEFEHDPDIYDTLVNTWDVLYKPINERDETVELHIWEERCRFFGEDSIFVNDATMAEVFIFYANKLAYDYGVDPLYALRSIFFAIGIDDTTGPTEIDDIMRQLMHHDYVSRKNRYGIFGLPMHKYESRIKTYPQVRINGNEDIGFDMEYNVFCDLYGDTFSMNWLDVYRDDEERSN